MSAPRDETPAAATSAVRLHKQLERIWGTAPGWGRLSAVNHTIVGRRFILTAFVFFGVGGVLAMLIRAQLATPRSAFLEPGLYNQIFTMHGTVMMFLFAIPMFEGLAIYLLPKMLGARDMAFPRLGAYGYWCYLFGGSILLIAMALGLAPDGGWFMYTPLSSKAYTPGINADIWLIGITFVEISALSAAVEIIATILKMRAPGMSLDKMPLLAWYLLVTAFMMLFGFPPLILGSVLLEVERAFDLPFFDAARGGDSLLWQHLFWLFGHPEVYIIFLPAAGMVSTILPVLARREIIGYVWIVVSIVALAFLSFGLWVHHMFTVGIPHLALAFFSAASTAVAVPTAVQIFAWIGTLAAGRPQLKLPMLYLLGFFSVFVIGGLTGVMLAIVPFNWQVHDTHFVVAHLHYVLVGGFIFPMLAAAYYWLPHFTGRVPRHSLGVPAFWLIIIGFNLTFLIMHWTGLLGMPRRISTYGADTGWEWLNLVSSIGGFVMAIGFALFTVDVVMHWLHGKRGPRNPWGAGTLEWAMATPPPSYNFGALPDVTTRSPLADQPGLANRLARGDGYLGFVRNGWLETLGVDMMSGRLEQIVRLPSPTMLPLFTALVTGVFFAAVLFKLYWLAVLALPAIVAMFLAWTPVSGERSDRGELPIGNGAQAILHSEAASPPSLWAMGLTLAADATAYASLAFGLLFLWVVAPNWPPLALIAWAPVGVALIAGGALLAALASVAATARRVIGSGPRREGALALAVIGQGAALAGLALVVAAVPDPTRHAYAAATLVILLYVGLHLAVGAVLAGFGIWRSRTGYVSARRSVDLRIGALWSAFTAALAVGTLLIVYGLPLVMGAPR
ncbi:cytochrome c oxidase subunit I [Rhodopseudomonas sp. HC1]|uniref:cytochrome c oxidase subunit I n=1 Tax=Rhodopseudomonas infernalis TaxID=2897386 RepID=UPI001EE90B6E|nr:cytochrome c oxidase subunit I [Rhodopseudomonas infernalis]MCG6204640.1 cytochrome c oxidase subunit I [Rhodopseudomonas infernalis]